MHFLLFGRPKAKNISFIKIEAPLVAVTKCNQIIVGSQSGFVLWFNGLYMCVNVRVGERKPKDEQTCANP